MGCGWEEITWFSGGEDAGGGGSVDFGEITWFSGGKMGAVRRILGRSHGFQGEKKGGGEIGRHQRSLKGEFWKIDCPPSSPSP